MFQESRYKDKYPQRKGGVIARLYPAIPRAGRVAFDLFDYEMLFADPPTNRIIRSGETIGCFYIESPGMRSLLRRLDVETFEMLTAASSIIRPGVTESGMMQEFIARHKDPRRREYLIPEMETWLGETYGVMIYQEDVIKVAHHVAGLTLEEADLLRRAMSGKMRSRDAMERLRQRFFTTAQQHKGLSPAVTAEIWRQIESFAGYAFCKAHSASFALLSYQVAFLKVHYPAEFMASVLSNGGGYYAASVYIQECRRLGLQVLLPCVNNSAIAYTAEGSAVRVGIMAVKNLPAATARAIISARQQHGPFRSLADFIVRTRAGYEDCSLLIRCGAMDCLGQTRPTLMRLLDVYIRRRRLLDDRYNDLFMHESFRLEAEVVTTAEYSLEEKCMAEQELLGYMVTRHPLHFFASRVSAPGVVTANRLADFKNRRVTMVGWYMASKRIRTKKGEIMKFLSLEDLTGTFEAVLFPRAYARFAEKTMSMGPFAVTGRVDAENPVNIIVDELELLAASELQASLQKDSAEHNYYGDEEKVNEEEFAIVAALGKEKLLRAYAG